MDKFIKIERDPYGDAERENYEYISVSEIAQVSPMRSGGCFGPWFEIAWKHGNRLIVYGEYELHQTITDWLEQNVEIVLTI